MINKILSNSVVKKVTSFAVRHKAISAIVLVAILFIGYKIVGSFGGAAGEIRYVTAEVTSGTIISSVSGSGQVSASNQIDLKPKASGDVVYIGVTAGQQVKAGTLIVQLDTSDAQKTVRDALANLESAKLSLEKLQQPADELSITQAENNLARAEDTKQSAIDDLARSYDDGFSAVSNAFLDLPDVMTGLQGLLFSGTSAFGGINQWNIDYYASEAARYDEQANVLKDDVYAKYEAARQAYDKAFQNYKATSRFSDNVSMESMINETYQTTKSVAESIKSSVNLIQFYKDTLTKKGSTPAATADTHLADLNTYTGTVNNNLSSLLSAKNSIASNKDSIVNAERTIAENTQSLANLKNGADELDLKSAQLTIKQRENSLADAYQTLANYYVRAPFDGTIAEVNVTKYDLASSGTAVATLVTQQKIAEISLNEVDVSKVKVGQKVNLSFDAVSDLTITGQVAEVDTIGTVSQGVVVYSVKISFDTQDDRVKSGMSVSATILTEIKQDVLVVASSAVKTQGDSSYVEMFDPPLENSSGSQGAVSAVPPHQQSVTVGISDDTSVEIVSGLKAGDQVVIKTITSSTSSSKTTTKSATSIFGGGGGGAVMFRN